MLFEFCGFLSALKKWYSCTPGPTYPTLMNNELSCVIAVSSEMEITQWDCESVVNNEQNPKEDT